MSTSTDFKPSVQTFTLTAGGTSEVLVAARAERSSIMIQPQTEVSLVNFGATAGAQATGTYTIGVNPTAADTIVFNGVTFTFIAGVSTATDIQIGATLADTITEALTVLNASVNASVSVATYSNPSAGVIKVTYDAGGTDGNAYTLGTNTANIVRSAATLSGGSDTVGGGISLAANTPYVFSAAEYPQVREDIYIVSASNSAKTVYLEGIQAV